MSKEVAVRSLKPGNFETSVEGVRFVLEVNKDEGGTCRGTYKLYVRSLSAVGMAEETEFCGQKLKKKKKLRRVSQNTTPY
jgi:hypothetical protein